METLFLALRVVVALAAVLGLIWFVQRRLTRGSGAKPTIAARLGGGARREIQVLGTHRLGAKASLTVVEVDGTKLLLGVTEQGIKVLEPAPAAPALLAPAPDDTPAQAAAPAEETRAPAGVDEPPAPDFAAILREALDEASDVGTAPAAPAAPVADAEEPLSRRRRRRVTVPALAEQLVPHMTRTLAGALGIRTSAPVAEPVATPVLPAAAPAALPDPVPAVAQPRARSYVSIAAEEADVDDVPLELLATPLAASAHAAVAEFTRHFEHHELPVTTAPRDYSAARPLAEGLPVLHRAS